MLAPFIKGANAIPRIVLASLFVIWFGLGMSSKVATAFVLVFFAVFFSAFQGAREVDKVLVDNARILGAGRWAMTVQKLVNAFVRTMKWIDSHNASDIAAKMPKDYNGGDPALYEKSIKDSSPMFTADGRMPDGGPQTVLDVLGTFSDIVKAKKSDIDLSQTYSTDFVDSAK